MVWIVLLGLALGLAWWLPHALFEGADPRGFLHPRPRPMREAASAQAEEVDREVRGMAGPAAGRARRLRGRVQRLRATLDAMGTRADLAGVEIRPAAAGGPRAEWVLPEEGGGAKRLLYLHGGGFEAGSPLSHRTITAELTRRTGCAVLAADYRLKPEHRRREGIADCRAAWAWLAENGPEGPAPAESMFVAGDSAGGSLTLSLIAWLRDTGGRQADAAVALSPGTDSTFSAPSLRTLAARDVMLGPGVGMLVRIPRPLLLWAVFLGERVRPNAEDLSPLLGSLHGLPPTLVQVSLAEVLLDDAVRWVNKARAAGSPADIQAWPGMVHVWQAFVGDLPEANEAYGEIEAFFERHAGRTASQRIASGG